MTYRSAFSKFASLSVFAVLAGCHFTSVGAGSGGATGKSVSLVKSAGAQSDDVASVVTQEAEVISPDFALSLSYNSVVKANLQSEAILAQPETALPPNLQIQFASLYWTFDDSVAQNCDAASGGVLGAACQANLGRGLYSSAMEKNRELQSSQRMLEFTVDARLLASSTQNRLSFFVVYLATDTSQAGSIRLGASELGVMRIDPANAKLFTALDASQLEASFPVALAPPVRDTSLSADGSGEIWVSTTGSDSNAGTFQAPVLTIGRAKALARWRWPNEAARAGKSIILRGGHYINGRGAMHRRYDLNFTPETYSNWNGVEGNPFKIRGYWGDSQPVVIDNHANDPAQVYGNPLALGAFDPYLWQDRQLVGADGIGNYGATIANSQNLVLEGITIYGAFIEGLDIDNTRNVSVRFVNIYGASKWGMQAFGQNVRNLEITGCKVMGTLLEHGIYIAAGAHGSESVGGIRIHHNELAYNGRNGIQVNGSHDGVLIEGNLIYRNYLAGIASTGNANVLIRDNFVAENLKQAITLLMYIDDSYWNSSIAQNNPADPYRRGMIDWRAKHFAAMGLTQISGNTLVVRSEKFDPTSQETPGSHGAIDVAQWGGFNQALGEFAHHPLRELRIEGNRIFTASTAAIRTQIDDAALELRGIKTMKHLRFTQNRISSAGGEPRYCTPFAAQWCLGGDIRTLTTMQQQYPLDSRGMGWSANSTSVAFSSMPAVDQVNPTAGRVDTLAFSSAHPFNRSGYVAAP